MDANFAHFVQILISIPVFIAIALLLKRELGTFGNLQRRPPYGNQAPPPDDETESRAGEYYRHPMYKHLPCNMWFEGYSNDESDN
jgi:hypothetical protein